MQILAVVMQMLVPLASRWRLEPKFALLTSRDNLHGLPVAALLQGLTAEHKWHPPVL